MRAIATIVERRELLANLVARELKSRYKGSVLGFLWTLLNPLFMAVIYFFFLRLLAGRGVPTTEIIIGVFAWQFTALCVNGGLASISGNSNLVKKVFFPRFLLPLAVTTANLVNYLLSLVVQFAIVALLAPSLRPWALALPLLILYHALFNFGLALVLSSANVYFRDTQHLAGILLSAWFFLSPVMYNLSFVEQFAGGGSLIGRLFLLNPITVIITGYRAMILPGVSLPWADWPWLAGGFVLPFLLLWAGWTAFDKSQRYFADLL